MKSNVLSVLIAAMLLAACTGAPTKVGTSTEVPVPTGPVRDLEAQACGFQLLLFIPIKVNSRASRAYQQLVVLAGGDYITDVEVKEEWTYGLVGTQYCTTLRARAIREQ
jgi:hypothetical protein